LAIAHRGGAGLAPENTLEAFRRSYALGVRYFETDVRATADGALVAFHDDRLEFVTAARGRVRSRTLAELTRTQVLGGGPIMALADLLAAFPDACFSLDIKDGCAAEPLAALLHDTGATPRICVTATRGSWLRAARTVAGPGLCTAVPWRDLVRLASKRRATGIADGFAHVPLRLGRAPVLWDDLVVRAHDLGVGVIVWTVNDQSTMHRLLDRGVDGVVTDRPDLLREVLIARGQWRTPDTYGVPAASRGPAR
jgi:glycerophosphoryl diester phosphodiesterase